MGLGLDPDSRPQELFATPSCLLCTGSIYVSVAVFYYLVHILVHILSVLLND
jgi:hypothetical protein